MLLVWPMRGIASGVQAKYLMVGKAESAMIAFFFLIIHKTGHLIFSLVRLAILNSYEKKHRKFPCQNARGKMKYLVYGNAIL